MANYLVCLGGLCLCLCKCLVINLAHRFFAEGPTLMTETGSLTSRYYTMPASLGQVLTNTCSWQAAHKLYVHVLS